MFEANAAEKPAEKPISTARSVVYRSLQRQRKNQIISFVCSAVFWGLSAFAPVAFGLLVDRTISSGDVGSFFLGLLVLALCYAVLTFCRRTFMTSSANSYENESHLLRGEVLASGLNPTGELDRVKTGEVASIAVSDIDAAAECARLGPVSVATWLNILILFGIVLAVNVWLGVACFVALAAYVVLGRTLLPLSANQSRENQRTLANTASLATDLITGVRTLRGVGAHHVAVQRYTESSARSLVMALRLARTDGSLQSIVLLLEGAFVATVLFLAGWLLLQDELTIGELIIAIVVTAKITHAIQVLNLDARLLAIGWAATARIASLLGMRTPPPGTQVAQSVSMDDCATPIAFRSVSFRSLTGLTFTLKQGELLGVACFDPCDSDALLAILSYKEYDNRYEGEIRLGGISIHDVDLNDRRKFMLLEQHDIALFEGTLRQNLLGSNKSLPDEQLTSALEAAAALDVVHSHPAGLDQPVTDRGLTFSGGQRQRIGLARALLANSPILVLPDPTTAIDPITEEIAATGLIKFRHTEAGQHSTVLITSSPTLLNKVDRVIVLGDGRVVDEGAHSDLLTRNSLYRQTVTR